MLSLHKLFFPNSVYFVAHFTVSVTYTAVSSFNL